MQTSTSAAAARGWWTAPTVVSGLAAALVPATAIAGSATVRAGGTAATDGDVHVPVQFVAQRLGCGGCRDGLDRRRGGRRLVSERRLCGRRGGRFGWRRGSPPAPSGRSASVESGSQVGSQHCLSSKTRSATSRSSIFARSLHSEVASTDVKSSAVKISVVAVVVGGPQVGAAGEGEQRDEHHQSWERVHVGAPLVGAGAGSVAERLVARLGGRGEPLHAGTQAPSRSTSRRAVEPPGRPARCRAGGRRAPPAPRRGRGASPATGRRGAAAWTAASGTANRRTHPAAGR